MDSDLVSMNNRVTTLEVLHSSLSSKVNDIVETSQEIEKNVQELREWRIAYTTRVAVYTTIGAVLGGVASQLLIGLALSLLK